MTSQSLTLVQGPSSTPIDVEIRGDRVLMNDTGFESAVGWTVKPEGFCFGDICIPAGAAVTPSGLVDLAAFAQRAGRPFVADLGERVLSLGASAAARTQILQSLEAPDFELPDLTGTMHRLSSYRGQKVLLAAYASW